MSDRDRLARILRVAARPPKAKRRTIVCYDAAWAGLPRVTINDRRRRPPARRIPWERPAPEPDHEWLARCTQMELPL